MFVLEKNNFLADGTCRYADENKNTVFMKRLKEDSFKVKVRLSDNKLHFDPIVVDMTDNSDGVYLPLNFNTQEFDVEFAESFRVLTNDLSKVIGHWWLMLKDIQNFTITQQAKASEEELMNAAAKLIKYQELEGVVNYLFGEPKVTASAALNT